MILKKEFILIYGTYFSSKEIIEIKKYAKLNNLIILSLSYYNIWADKNLLDIDPNGSSHKLGNLIETIKV